MNRDRAFLRDLLDTWQDDIEFLEEESDGQTMPRYERGYRDGLNQAIDQTYTKAERANKHEAEGEIYSGIEMILGALD